MGIYRIKYRPKKHFDDTNLKDLAFGLAFELISYLKEFSTPEKQEFYMSHYVQKQINETFSGNSINGVRYECVASINNMLVEKGNGFYTVTVMGTFDYVSPKVFEKEV